jgi:hypothetical protein
VPHNEEYTVKQSLMEWLQARSQAWHRFCAEKSLALDAAFAQQALDIHPQVRITVLSHKFVSEDLFCTLLTAIPGTNNSLTISGRRRAQGVQ